MVRRENWVLALVMAWRSPDLFFIQTLDALGQWYLLCLRTPTSISGWLHYSTDRVFSVDSYTTIDIRPPREVSTHIISSTGSDDDPAPT